MLVKQFHFHQQQWFPELPISDSSQLLLIFGERDFILQPQFYDSLARAFPRAEFIGCTTSGEIHGTEVYDGSVVVSALNFKATDIHVLSGNIKDYQRAFDAGLSLADSLAKDNLQYVMVLSDGHIVNGTELVDGISQSLPGNVLVTGGMAGDGQRFEETLVWHNDIRRAGEIVLCGFYGDAVRVGHGSLGGWSSFGPQRQITRSSGSRLYELDGMPALTLYKKYLGNFSEQLPASALRFPLSLQLPGETDNVVRTILDIDEATNSMVFAGDMPKGSSVKMMRANFETLIDGASEAAAGASHSLNSNAADFALLVSCVGRRLVLGQRAFEELEAVEDILGKGCALSGFYSYGEISPLLNSVQCRLHNQTMTITTFTEELDA